MCQFRLPRSLPRTWRRAFRERIKTWITIIPSTSNSWQCAFNFKVQLYWQSVSALSVLHCNAWQRCKHLPLSGNETFVTEYNLSLAVSCSDCAGTRITTEFSNIQSLNYRWTYKILKRPDDGLIRAETCREYRSYLIKTLSIVAKQKVLLFTVNIQSVVTYQQ
jgi:hypothetical protein